MKQDLMYLMAGILCLNLLACNMKSTETSDTGWVLLWEENFDGNEIDYTTWSKIPRGRPDWCNYMSDYEGLFDVADGNLILRGMVNDVLPNDTAPFITGGVYTKDKVTFGEGRMEIRALLHGAVGAWPAFWMLPEFSGWPEGGEIDIMERLGYDDYVYQTVHSRYTYDLNIHDPETGSTAPINPDQYNTYAVEKHADSLVFFVNDVRTFAYPRIETDIEGQFPFTDEEFYLLLDMQLGGSWVGRVDPETLPVEMLIDWVRFYGPKE